MKLLIVTQKVDRNDPVLGFFHGWIIEFSKYYEKVSVICLEEGTHDLPANVSVYSLGKEKGVSRVGYASNFYRYIWSLRKEYDVVFVHMNPEYVILGGELWKMLHKKIALWYVHRQVDPKLRIATFLSDIIFTSARESFGIKSSKVRFVGHGIDVDKFPAAVADFSEPLRILHLGRITKIKHIDTVLKASKLLIDRGIRIGDIRMTGAPVMPEDRDYKTTLQALARELGIQDLLTWDESNDDAKTFTASTISINAAPDGGMDKAVLGSLAAGHPAFVSNKAFKGVLGPHWEMFSYEFDDAESLAHRIIAFLAMDESMRQKAVSELEGKVRLEYDVRALIERITDQLNAKPV
ncbi:MAG: hypothetical protein JWN50_434 [Parcubacteria group bacterium]|nr:hypothetical protein [Parcubacteria group bacterium]